LGRLVLSRLRAREGSGVDVDACLLERPLPHPVAAVHVEGRGVGQDHEAGDRAEHDADPGEPRDVPVPEVQDQGRGERDQQRANCVRHDGGLAVGGEAGEERSHGCREHGCCDAEDREGGVAVGAEHWYSLVVGIMLFHTIIAY
jgi:hypothetical protein